MESLGVAESRAKLADALRAYAAAPGRFALHLGEPIAMFREFETVAQWAMGRLPESLEDHAVLKETAVGFLKRACFAQGLTHYQTFGMQAHEFTPEKLRTRYRALIRLTHPDVGIVGLGQDAALRVNLANDTLSDECKRMVYDATLRQTQTLQTLVTPGTHSAAQSRLARPERSVATRVRRGHPKPQPMVQRARVKPVAIGIGTLCILGIVGNGIYAMLDDSTVKAALVVNNSSHGAMVEKVGAAAREAAINRSELETLPTGGPPLRIAQSLAKVPESSPPPAENASPWATGSVGLNDTNDFWVADTVQARDLLGRILTSLTHGADARIAHQRLRDQRITGSLLVPVLTQLDLSGAWLVQHSGWVDEVHPSGILLRSRVTLDPKDGTTASQATAMAFVMEADFRTNREGARLTRLNLRAVP